MLLCGVKKCLLFPVEAREYLVVIWYERTMSFRRKNKLQFTKAYF